jgi:lysophospholipase L1-like esterase
VNDRRIFLKNSLFAAAFSRFIPERFLNRPNDGLLPGTHMNGKVVLFQGDSITDGNRTRNTDWNHVMGHGYAYTIASRLWFEHPSHGFHFFNRGVSGNRITHLTQRWQTDTLDLRPDVLSILIGINDVSGYIQGDQAFAAEQFETGYRALLRLTLEKQPEVRLVLCEPFILPVGRVKDNWAVYQKEVGLRQEIVKKLATEFNAIHVPFQSAFDAALQRAPAEYWIWDGIHPMPAGHELMARLWQEKCAAVLGIS